MLLKNYFLVLALVFYASHGIGHEMNMTTYSLTQEGECLFVEVTFDKDNIMKEIGLEHGDDIASLNAIDQYLASRFQVIVQGKVLPLYIERIDLGETVMSLYLNAKLSKETINSLSIYNTTMTNIDGHSNLMKININNMLRMFRMHNERTKINVNYDENGND